MWYLLLHRQILCEGVPIFSDRVVRIIFWVALCILRGGTTSLQATRVKRDAQMVVVVSHVARWARNCSSYYHVPLLCLLLYTLPHILLHMTFPSLSCALLYIHASFLFLYIWCGPSPFWRLLPRWATPGVSLCRSPAFHGLHQIPLHNGLQVFLLCPARRILLVHTWIFNQRF